MARKNARHFVYLTSIVACVCMLLAALTGCTGSVKAESNNNISTTKVSDTKEVSAFVIGIKRADSSSVTLANKTGQGITDVAIRETGEEDYPAGMMIAGQTWESGKKGEIFYTTADDEDAHHDLLITIGEDEYELEDLDLRAVNGGAIMLDKGEAYITYKVNGEVRSTRSETPAEAPDQPASETSEATQEEPQNEADAAPHQEDEGAAQENQAAPANNEDGYGEDYYDKLWQERHPDGY